MNTPSSNQEENATSINTKDTRKEVEKYANFDDMNLKEPLLKGIYGYGFEKPSEIQKLAIIPISKGNDIIVQAQSGCGKTATYTIGLLQQIDAKGGTQGLVLVPTRELVTQVTDVVRCIGDYMDIQCHACMGGTNISGDINSLRAKPQVIIGTPGRIRDMIDRGHLDTRDLKIIVLDEADEILSRGFAPDIDFVFSSIPKSTQITVCSATLPPDIHTLCNRLLNDPVRVTVEPEHLTLDGIKQFYVDVEKDDYKFETLCDLFSDISVSQTVIFCNSVGRVDRLASNLRQQGFPADSIHSQLSHAERMDVMKRFRIGNIRVLVCSDLIARGIDTAVAVVVNYDMTPSKETYLHRIGRCGRFGKRGAAISFITRRDINTLREFERHYNVYLEELPKNINDLI